LGTAAAITLLIVILIAGTVTAILRYVAENAAIRMVDEYERSDVKVGFRQGWKYGWNKSSWHLFLINLVAHIPGLILFVILGLVAWWIISSALNGVDSAFINSLVAGIGLSFLFIFITALVSVLLFVLRDFAWRLTVLEGSSPLESLRKAATLVTRNWKSVGLMWLVMIGLKIAWAIAFVILVIPLLIVSIITALGGLLVAIVPALVTAGISSLLSAPDYWPWVFALIIGLPLFSVVAFSPILLVSGWFQIYQSSVWTLTYRELKALAGAAPAVVETK
jgi:tetrahydromethanopterin S-methyltransferase subunit F